MRKITAIAVALGFLTSVSLPAFATPVVHGVVKSDDLSAAKKKKKKKKDDGMNKGDKKTDLGITDLSAAKKKKKKKKDGRRPRTTWASPISRLPRRKMERTRATRRPRSSIASLPNSPFERDFRAYNGRPGHLARPFCFSDHT